MICDSFINMISQEEIDWSLVKCLIELLPMAARWGVFAPEGEENFREVYKIVSEQMDIQMELAGYNVWDWDGEMEWDGDFEGEAEEEEEEKEEEGEEEVEGEEEEEGEEEAEKVEEQDTKSTQREEKLPKTMKELLKFLVEVGSLEGDQCHKKGKEEEDHFSRQEAEGQFTKVILNQH